MSDANANTAPYKRVPYGEQQGSFLGVVACSNRGDGFFSGENNYVNHSIYTGFRYQCVEYARRFLLYYTGCVFGNCGRASEIFRMKHITHVETGAEYPLVHHANNTAGNARPEPGDIIIYPYDAQRTPWGHVGVISYVDDTRVGIIEQNQFFGLCVSPSPDYLGGEPCVMRYVELLPSTTGGGSGWHLREGPDLPDSVGWLSYPEAPRRPAMFAPFDVLPAMAAVRSIPYDDDAHACTYHLPLNSPIELAVGPVTRVVGMRSGAGECLIGAGTASARILRCTLQLLFKRQALSPAFLTLPQNPLRATLRDDVPQGVADVMAVLAALGAEVDNEAEVLPALAAYFGLPVEWIAAMQREFSLFATHGAMVARLFPRYPPPAELEAARAARRAKREAEAATSTTATAAAAAGTGSGAGPSPTSSPMSPTAPTVVQEFPMANPKEELWQLVGLDFHPLEPLLGCAQVREHVGAAATALQLACPHFRAFGEFAFRRDLNAYFKEVESARGPRSCLTIVLPAVPTDVQRAVADLLADYCEFGKYPVRLLSELDLQCVGGRLRATPSEASPPFRRALADYDVDLTAPYDANFVHLFTPWHEVLVTRAEEHAALREAALHPDTDVVFTAPLFSYLCDGLTNRLEPPSGAPGSAEREGEGGLSHSVKFYDLVRRLQELSLPHQPYQSWDIMISEFKGSCRRVHVGDRVPRSVADGCEANVITIDFADSAYFGFSDVVLSDEEGMPLPPPTRRHPSIFLHLFPISEDDA